MSKGKMFVITPVSAVEKVLLEIGTPLAMEWIKDDRIKKALAATYSDSVIMGEEITLENVVWYYLEQPFLMNEDFDVEEYLSKVL